MESQSMPLPEGSHELTDRDLQCVLGGWGDITAGKRDQGFVFSIEDHRLIASFGCIPGTRPTLMTIVIGS